MMRAGGHLLLVVAGLCAECRVGALSRDRSGCAAGVEDAVIEQTKPGKPETLPPEPINGDTEDSRPFVAVAVLLYVVLILWGLILAAKPSSQP